MQAQWQQLHLYRWAGLGGQGGDDVHSDLAWCPLGCRELQGEAVGGLLEPEQRQQVRQ